MIEEPLPYESDSSAEGRASAGQVTARQWELANGPAIVAWLHGSGLADSQHEAICRAAENLITWWVQSDSDTALRVLQQFPNVLSKCDDLSFEDADQALAYLLLHLPDRYCRVRQVLERLLVGGALPVGRSQGFAVLDVGAGPGPALFAARHFYAALAYYARRRVEGWTIAPVQRLHAVERSRGMHAAMHWFAEHLWMIEQQDAAGPSLYTQELQASGMPFGASFHDFRGLSIRQEHDKERYRLRAAIYEDDEDMTSWGASGDIAFQSPMSTPSAYGLVMCVNFLTRPEMPSSYEDEIRNLTQSLVPGGVLMVLGGTGKHYKQIFNHIDEYAAEAHLRRLGDLGSPLRAAERPEDLRRLESLTRRTWLELESLAGDVSDLKNALHKLRADDIYSDERTYRLPQFQVRAYRRGKWPKAT